MLVMMEKVAIMANMLLHAFTPERDTSHFTNWSPVHCHIVHSQSQKTTVLHSLWFPSCPLPRYPVTVIFLAIWALANSAQVYWRPKQCIAIEKTAVSDYNEASWCQTLTARGLQLNRCHMGTGLTLGETDNQLYSNSSGHNLDMEMVSGLEI